MEYELKYPKRNHHHHAEQGKQRHDLGDNNFSVLAGDMISCSIVPASRSFTIAADATSELSELARDRKPQSPMNQESTRPGL